MCRLTGARRRVNVALNRQSWQSSTYCDRLGCHGAYKANDGNTRTSHYRRPGCAHTRKELNPWWVVDLGAPVYVDGVDLTSRNKCCGE